MKKINNKIKKILKTGEKQNINKNKMFKKQSLVEFINNKFKNLEYQKKIQANHYHSEYPLKKRCIDSKCEFY